MPSTPDRAHLLFLLDTGYEKASWHGTNLRGSIRGLSLTQAAWRPAPRRHNIWELVVHAAYWKYAAWRRLTGAVRGSFPEKGSNWFERPVDMSTTAWRADVALLHDMHRALRAAVEASSDQHLRHTVARSRVSNMALVTGVAAHDLYHAGQIQLLKRLSTLDLGARRRRPDEAKKRSSSR